MVAPMTRKTKPALTSTATSEGGRSLWAEIGESGRKTAQRSALLGALRASGWNVTRAAEALGVKRQVLSAAIDDLIPDEARDARAEGLLRAGRPTSDDS
jgi:transcriptional regulator with GAF, ATPase, and Fis domain